MTYPIQRGSAIVSAMLVAAIAAAAATGMLATQSLWLQESETARHVAQCRYASRAGVAWAAAILRHDERTSAADHLNEPWAAPLPPTSIENATVSGDIRDLNSRFNINNLVRNGIAQPREVARYKRLLSSLALPAGLADTLTDWIDSDAAPSGVDGAEDDYYLSLSSGYRTAGRGIVDIQELLRVKGYTTSVFTQLAPYITALPTATTINVNTAPAPVLMLAADGLTPEDTALLIAARERGYFRDVADFQRRMPTAVTVNATAISVVSDYFMVTAQVKCGEAQVRQQAILRRGFNAMPTTVFRRFN
jgi:general secretion pathway protein K